MVKFNATVNNWSNASYYCGWELYYEHAHWTNLRWPLLRQSITEPGPFFIEYHLNLEPFTGITWKMPNNVGQIDEVLTSSDNFASQYFCE